MSFSVPKLFSVSKCIPYILGAVVALVVTLGAMRIGEANASTSTGSGRVIGAYLLMQHSNPTAAAGVFRVNVNTGYVSYCYIDQSSKPGVTCTAETP